MATSTVRDSTVRIGGAKYIISVLTAILIALGSHGYAQGTDIQRGGAIVDAWGHPTDNLDPHLASSRSNAWMSLLYDTLLSYTYNPSTGDFDIGPALAESYAVVDDTTIEFSLRRDVTFHDGSRFDANVAAWNLERARDHEASVVTDTMANIDEVEVVGDYTIRLHLVEPQPVLPLQLTPANQIGIWFVSRQAVESMGDDAFGQEPVGSGPFMFERWIPDNRLDLVAYPDHWELGEDGLPLPYADSYSWRLIADQAVANLELRSGEVNVFFDPALRDLVVLERDPQAKVQTVPGTFKGYPSFYFNPQTEELPFSSDVRLRLAAQHAVDREAMAAALGFGVGEPQHIFGWYPGVPGYDPDLEYAFDPERSRELLAEAGYADGIDLEVKVINRSIDVQPLEVLQAMFANVGIRLEINLMDRLEWIDDGRAGSFEALAHGNTARPSPLLRQETRCGSTNNWAGYCNPLVDALWEQAEVEYDLAERARIYQEIQAHLYEDAYHLMGYRFPRAVALKESVEGITTQENLRYVWIR